MYILSNKIFALIDVYFSKEVRVDWAPERAVYKHKEKDR